MKKTRVTINHLLVVSIMGGLLFGVSGMALAQVMTSPDFRIQSDSINVGGVPGTSADFRLNDTIGEIATGEASSPDFILRAGYQQMQGGSISISAAPDIVMDGLSLSQNSAVGSSTWTVITNNVGGYALSVRASAAPALVDAGTGESFTDYTEASAGVKETWSVTSAYEFGFSGFGADTTGYGIDTNCADAENIPSTGLLWEGFNGLTNIQLASTSSPTAGTDTTICVATEQDVLLTPSGSYSSTITATAVVL